MTGSMESEQHDVGTAARPDSAGAPTVGDVIAAVEELWPPGLAEGWDAVGPVVGRREREVSRIVLAVDPTAAVVDDALARGADLILCHHPLMLKPVHSVAASGFKGEVVHRLIEAGCALVTAHTNADSAVGGVSDVLATALGLRATTPLAPSVGGSPEEGIGRVGNLEHPVPLGTFARTVSSVLPATPGGVRVAGDRDAPVQRIAVCGGAGDSLLDRVRAAGADVYVTADLRHHPASEVREAAAGGRPYLIDVSHFASESLWLSPAAASLGGLLSERGFRRPDLHVSTVSTDPWDFVLAPEG